MSMNISGIEEIFEEWNVKSLQSLNAAARDDRFRKALISVLRETAKRNGATLTLTTAAIWISAAIGSIGIAGLGGAVGLPLAVILIPLGLLGGGFLDEDGLLSRTRKRYFSAFGFKNVGDQRERDSELAIIAQSIQLVSDRVDSVSEQLESVRNDVSSLNQAATLLAKRQRLLSWIVWALLVILAAVVLVSAVTWNRWWVLIRVHH